MMTWLDWFCRHTSGLLPEKRRSGDPRTDLAIYAADWVRAAKQGKIAEVNLLEEFFYVLISLFSASYLPVGANASYNGQPAASPLGLVVTRDTANLLADAKLPANIDMLWRPTFGDNRGIYVDVPHGALLVELAPGDVVELRAILAGTLQLPAASTETSLIFIGLLTGRGSERGRGRLLGMIRPDGTIVAVASTRFPRLTQADASLKAPFVDQGAESLARERTGEFLRLVLAYHAFGPAEAREELQATETRRLKQGKPGKGQSFFALTRLHPAHDRLGRPTSSESSGWTITSRQDVTGHFKLQAYGPAASLRRLIWVKGYARGPLDAPAKPRAYSL